MPILGALYDSNRPRVEQYNFMGKNLTRIPESGLRLIEEYERKVRQAEETQNKEPILSLTADLRTRWQAAYQAKIGSGVEEILFQCLRQKKAQYDPDKLAKIQTAGRSEIYMPITGIICDTVAHWIQEVEIPIGEKPYSISETPIPTLPKSKDQEILAQVIEETKQLMIQNGINSVSDEQIQNRMNEMKEKIQKERREYAKKEAQKQEILIEDELQEGGYYPALSKFIRDFCIYPAAFLKGPIIRRKKSLVWTEDQNGNQVPAIETVPKKEYYSPSPFDIYPSPGSKNVQDGYLFERHRLRRSDIISMKGVPGFNSDAIDGVLMDYGRGGLRDWLSVDVERGEILNMPFTEMDPEAVIDCLEYWGYASGRDLLEWGIDPNQIPDPTLDYQITAWLIGNWLIMVRLNPNPLGDNPYYSASYDTYDESIWGGCPPKKVRGTQNVCNAATRSLVDNMAISSGPQVEVYVDRLDNPADIKKLVQLQPWQIHLMIESPHGTGGRALNFYQPDSQAETFMRVYKFYFEQASEQTGIPRYMYGSSDTSGGGKTAHGLSMLFSAATKVMKGIIKHIDENIIVPSIRNHWLNIMLFNDNIEKTGDINIIARASEHLIMAEQIQLRRTEALDRVTRSNSILDIIGKEGLTEILRDYFTGLKFDADKIVPDETEMQPPPMMVPPEGVPPGEGHPNLPNPAIIDQIGREAKGNQMWNVRRPALGP